MAWDLARSPQIRTFPWLWNLLISSSRMLNVSWLTYGVSNDGMYVGSFRSYHYQHFTCFHELYPMGWFCSLPDDNSLWLTPFSLVDGTMISLQPRQPVESSPLYHGTQSMDMYVPSISFQNSTLWPKSREAQTWNVPRDWEGFNVGTQGRAQEFLGAVALTWKRGIYSTHTLLPLLMFSSPSSHPLAHLSFPCFANLSWSHEHSRCTRLIICPITYYHYYFNAH